MKTKYGEFTTAQIQSAKKEIRKNIIFLLSIVDPKLKEDYKHIDVNAAFNSLLMELGGMNELFFCPVEIVTVMSLLEAALIEYNSPEFDFAKYRKLVLDAGAKVELIKEVDDESTNSESI